MLRPPAILQVLPALGSGGVERGTIEIAEAISAAGLRAVVASSGGRLVEELEAVGGVHAELPLDAKSPWFLWRNALRLKDIIRREGVRIVHARSRAPAWSALWAAKMTGAAFVTTYHGTYNEDLPGKRFYNSVMARGRPVIAISRFIAEHVHERHRVPHDGIRLIPRGVDLRRFDPTRVSSEQVARTRTEWRIPEGEAALLMPARLARWKGQAVLIEALQRVPRATVILAGDLANRERYQVELESLAASLGVEKRVRFVGHVAEMAAALLAADVVIHASTQPEAFGRAIVEAQAMARPVIAADLGGPRETVLHGVTGWLVTPGDAQQLAARINEVLAMSAQERWRVGQVARSQVPTIKAMQAATVSLYLELL